MKQQGISKYQVESLLQTTYAQQSKFDGTAAPAVTDDTNSGYEAGSLWVDATNSRVYVCISSAVGAAVWRDITLRIADVTAADFATKSGAETLTNKTIDGDSNTVQDLPITAIKTDVARANKYLKFNASGVPTADFDESGTFTPEVYDNSTGGNQAASYGTRQGFYTRKGNTVSVYVNLVDIVKTGMTGSNPIYIRNLPFASTSGALGGPSNAALKVEGIAFTNSPYIRIGTSVSRLLLEFPVSGSTITQILVSAMTSGSNAITFRLTYETA